MSLYDFGKMYDDDDNVILNYFTLNYLEEKYTADVVPPCRVCGGKLSIARAGGGERTKYAHSRPDGVSFDEWSEHYTNSSWYQNRIGDDMVIALIKAFKEK